MEKEINEIPTVIERILSVYNSDKNIAKSMTTLHRYMKKAPCIHICACGTSYHAGLVIGRLIEKHVIRRVKTHIANEFTPDCILSADEIGIVISQSGETADTIACMQAFKKHSIPIISLCNVTSSTIAKQSDLLFPLLCGAEVAVASTKAFVASLLVGCILVNAYRTEDFALLPQMAKDLLAKSGELIPLPPKDNEKIFFIGRGIDYFLSLESALKVKEVTYLHCEGYPAGELKHGTLSLIDDKTLSVVYLSHTSNTISEISARGGRVVQLPSPSPSNPLSFVIKIIPAQIFALRLSERLGINPDRPRNLAKSVTVE